MVKKSQVVIRMETETIIMLIKYRNKPVKPYHSSENHSLISYQNSGEKEIEEEEKEEK